MKSFAKYQLQLAKERRFDEYRVAADARRVDRPSQPLRRSVGQSIVRIGERLAGEPSLELARSR